MSLLLCRLLCSYPCIFVLVYATFCYLSFFIKSSVHS
nr:MAG TPA: N-terminal domain with HPIH motif [Caudoviricetes sp.]